jgi:hypothetical protein
MNSMKPPPLLATWLFAPMGGKARWLVVSAPHPHEQEGHLPQRITDREVAAHLWQESPHESHAPTTHCHLAVGTADV